MTSQSSSLFSLAHVKLNSSVNSKDNCSLHRWVLLKNSIIRSAPVPAPTVTTTATTYAVDPSEDLLDCQEECFCLGDEETGDSFMFPDAGNIMSQPPSSDSTLSEAEWLDSLLESLEDDDVDPDLSAAPPHDEDAFISSNSPMSSSDDLTDSAFFSPLASRMYSYPYLVPYPPFHPPLIHSHDFDGEGAFRNPNRPVLPALTLPSDALPYHNLADVEDDISVPDAIEDDSDDESDAPCTPMLTDSTASSCSSADPTSIPPPEERIHQRQPRFHVYIDASDDYFYPFELDPLPFPDETHSYNPYAQEC